MKMKNLALLAVVTVTLGVSAFAVPVAASAIQPNSTLVEVNRVNVYSKQVESEKYISIIVSSELPSANTKGSETSTIVIDKATNKHYKNLTDLLGKDAYKTADETIKKAMKAAPEGTYNMDDFKGTGDTTKFYVDNNGKVVVIFDKYEIAPGSTGSPEFVISK